VGFADSRDPRSSKTRFWIHAGKVRRVNRPVDCRNNAPNPDPRVAMRQHRANVSIPGWRRRNTRSVATNNEIAVE